MANGIGDIPRAKPRPSYKETPWEEYDRPPIEMSRIEQLFRKSRHFLGFHNPPLYGQSNQRMNKIPTEEYIDYALENLGYGEWHPKAESVKGNTKVGISSIDLENYPMNDVDKNIIIFANMLKPKGNILNEIQRSYVSSTELPIAELGFDTSSMYFNDVPVTYNLGGMYRPSSDTITITGEGTSDTNLSLVHESTHRGLEKLKENGFKLRNKFGKLLTETEEEALVRYMLKDKLGEDYVSQKINNMPKDVRKEYIKFNEDEDTKKLVDNINMLAAIENGIAYDEWVGAMD